MDVNEYEKLRNCWIEIDKIDQDNKYFWECIESEQKLLNDGTIDMRIAFDPFNIRETFKKKDFRFSEKWIRLFKSTWIQQKSKEWLKRRRYRIQGSDLSLVLAIGQDFERYDKEIAIEKAHSYLIELKKDPESFDGDLPAIKHGNTFEGKAGYTYTIDHEDLTFQFGVIDHENINYMLSVSPDLVSWKYQNCVEIKCPFSRDILKNVKKEDKKSLKVIEKELLWNGKTENYKMITNLKPEMMNFMKNLESYYHQCQLQMEVINLDKDWMTFAQFGTDPNKNYIDNTLITYSIIKKDPNWLHSNMKYFEKFWNKMLIE
jgi:hypothetical protein